jgi:anti-sigma regulatory factor (Ser/Thr protein kinase)
MSGDMSGWLPAPVSVAPAADSDTGSLGGISAEGGPGLSRSAGYPVEGEGVAAGPAPGSQAENLARDWPLGDFIELGALPSSVPCARYHARQILWEWGLDRLSDSVELVVDELVTNAVAASRDLDWPFPVRMWLLSDRANVLVLVWDANPQPPVRIDPGDDAESGRGLLLVEAISAQWDWYAGARAGGKLVHALITG